MKTMCDLFCGTRYGWTKGFVAHGWQCIGIDIVPVPDYPGEFIQADIAHLYELPEADFYCCSSPCEQFSVHGMKHFHPNPKWPWLGIALFEHARKLLEATGKPYVMENVRAAQGFIGRSDYHFGPFHLWGNSLAGSWPWPPELSRLVKGIRLGGTGSGYGGKGYPILTKEEKKAMRKLDPMLWASSGSRERKEATAKAAEIPFPLSSHIARTAGCL